jgi:glyoxylase-like metal-dependent hydrolase (beta-lactamase superfamily II)
MPAFICNTCGVQYPPSDEPPAHCPICEDERQYVGFDGQRWTTLDALRAERHNAIRQEEDGLYSIRTTPQFGIGQRALLARSPSGNVLWDCLTLLDAETYAAVQALGGIQAIAISHPHFYGAMTDWSEAFNAPVYIHAADAAWVQRPGDALTLWQGAAHPILEGVTVLNPGGHFDGAAALHWAGGAEGRGALLSADTVAVNPTRQTVSFMYSYPNLIPLPASEIERIRALLESLTFDRIYGAWWPAVVSQDAKGKALRSADRYLAALAGARPA